eukprot:GHVR01112089.1.p1 GENE.GHVR01112089.1~~GHVR01112089.1.p1  ORF type:complete len:238 (+),score=25.00 GHVR01112089.1:27-716(+)
MCDKTRTLYPMVTGSSVLGIRYKDGVMIAADTCLYFGKRTHMTDVSRIHQVNETTVIGCSGEYSDFQYLKDHLERCEVNDWINADGISYGPAEYSASLARLMFSSRMRFNPLWNQIVVAGQKKGKSYLGYLDLNGTAFEDSVIATGMGLHLTSSLLRDAQRDDMSEADARALLEQSFRVLFYRHTSASPKIQIATVTNAGVNVSSGYTITHKWDHELWMTRKDIFGESW